jgi:type VI secretion system protein ImpL
MLPQFVYPIIRSHWFKTGFGVAVLILLLWFFGPLIGIGQMHPFDSLVMCLIATAVLIVLWVIVNLLTMFSRKKHEKDLVENVVKEPDKDAAAAAEEVALLRDRLREAMQQLKKSPGGRRERKRLHELPWYLFIGPPGAGKTTALVNSGLNFPLADAKGPTALRGVGGTRNCEWWFTDQSVLIDTAGRYTTQDSQAAADAGAWLGFLRLLKKHRRRQPLNGVLLTIGLSDLSTLSDSERQAHATAMRKRIRELHTELGVRVPVYVLFTKVDLLAGFVEFYDNLGKEEREQVWGMTLPIDDGRDEAGAIGAFTSEFDLLLARLNDRMLERLSQETDVQRRRLIYGFPQQFASMRDTAGDFLTEIFRPSRLEERPLLRGVYFTSGTQNGTPIDRLLGVMAGQFGLPRQSVTAFSGAGRSFFLTRLLGDVVFGEASLVSLDKKLEARTRWTYRGAYGGAALVLLLLSLGWTNSYIGNREMIDEAHGAAAKYDAEFAEVAKRGPNDTDLRVILPPLNTLRTMRGGYDQREVSTPLTLTFGLYQGEKITSASIEAYYRALNALLLPRLLARLEMQLNANLDKPEFLYEALKVYLILGRQGPIDHDQVMAWLIRDFNATMPGDDEAADRDALLAHADAMLERPLTALPLNGPLVDKVRAILTQEPLAEYSYNRILRSPRVQQLPEWTVADNGGAGSGKVFALRSGNSLNSGMPGIFTWAGYHNTFLPLMPTVTKDIAEDGWVLGREHKGGVAGTVAEVNKLRKDVVLLYLDEYVRRWDKLIADVAVKQYSNVNEVADELALMSGPNSPLRNLLQAIDVQTQLSRASATDSAQAQLQDKAAKMGQKAAGFGAMLAKSGLTLNQTEIANILGEAFGSTPDSAPVDPATRVDQHFKALHDFAAAGKDGPAPMEAALQKIAAISSGMSQVTNSANQGQALLNQAAGGGAGAVGAAAQLQDAAKDLPKPIANMLQTVAQTSSAAVTAGAGRELTNAWKSQVLPLCDAALFDRYPFSASSANDVPTDDFARLLGPGGMIDKFFTDNLKPFVDTSVRPWKWQAANNSQLSLQPGTLVQFQNAAEIRDALFNGGSQIAVKFTLVPVSLDAGVAQITIDIGGQSLTYNHGPTESTQFQWPGQGGKTLVRVTMTPASGNATVIEKDGAWALLRMLDSARVIPSGQPDKFRLVFGSPAGNATFELNASSVRNPFTLPALRAFRCPATL